MRAERTTTIDRLQERGVALIAALLIMLLMSALMIGFTTVVMSDQRYRGIDKDRARAFYGAQSGLEKLSTDLGTLFLDNVAPTTAQIAALANTPPTIPDVTYVAPNGVTAYGVTLTACDNQGNTTCNGQIGSGPYQGLVALKRKFNLDAVARTANGGEAHLKRTVETVAIPVFQFGMFSDVDLSFFAGPNFNFGGRVHTNGNLFLAQGGGAALTLTDKVTAVKDIIRQVMQNGVSIDTVSTHDGTVSMATAPNSFRPLLRTEGSVTGGAGSSLTGNWNTISMSYYNGYIRNGGLPNHQAQGTGAKVLNLPMVSTGIGGQNTDLTRRPPVNENNTNAILFGERDFDKTSLRILLSDSAAEITNLPRVTATAPVRLGDENGAGAAALTNDWRVTPPNNGTAYGPVDATHPPIARSPGLVTINTTANTTVPGAAPNGDITVGAGNVPVGAVAGVSNLFHVPVWPVTVTTALNAPLATIKCSSIVPGAPNAASATFTNCKSWPAVILPAVPVNSKILITVDGIPYSAATTVAVTAGANANSVKNYTVALANMAPFATNHLWMNDAAGQAQLVTCTGLDSGLGAAPLNGNTTTTFTNCLGTPATNFPVTISTQAVVGQNVGLIGGFLKIEMQKADLTWQDVTMEILNWGFAATNQSGFACPDPTPNAIVRFQRLRDNASNVSCSYASSLDSYDYWPNALFDTREALYRDAGPGNANVNLGGVMHFVSLDVGNLAKWLKGSAPYGAGSGVNALSNNGYSVYFSDRRNNRDLNNLETGEFGFEDVVNPLNANGTPNGALDGGEDVNANTVVDVYGQFPAFNGARNTMPNSAVAGFTNAIRLNTMMTPAQALTNRPFFFRHALKLVNGGLPSFTTPGVTGLTVVAENPVYIQGDWNWNAAAQLTDPHAETSVISDAVTLLSSSWTDYNSFDNPYSPNNRVRANPSWYRVAIIAGKGMAFPWPAAGNPPNDFGTDGGAHNFLRYLESGSTVNYRGAIATFYYNRQAVGTYKCCNTVYGAPARNYNFDTDFLNPATLPPLTPVFRDINALGFSQEIRPGR